LGVTGFLVSSISSIGTTFQKSMGLISRGLIWTISLITTGLEQSTERSGVLARITLEKFATLAQVRRSIAAALMNGSMSCGMETFDCVAWTITLKLSYPI
jgi:hypothetical protein